MRQVMRRGFSLKTVSERVRHSFKFTFYNMDQKLDYILKFITVVYDNAESRRDSVQTEICCCSLPSGGWGLEI